MNLRRFPLLRTAGVRLLPFALAASSFAVACGGDDASVTDTGSAGSAGATAGTKGGAAGASAGQAGASGTSGASGASGASGKAGAAGATAGGSGGDAGAGGSAAGNAGAAGDSAAGAAGAEAGNAGAGGDTTNACGVPEGAECSTGLKGACGVGHEKCIQGVLSCVQDFGPGEKPETCNGVDDDCDGVIDNGLPVKTFFKDEDGDGFGSNATASGCQAPEGYVEKGNDCVDTNAAINPGAAELCNEVDDNCNGTVDEGVQKPVWYRDSDGDGYGSTQQTVACFKPDGFVADAGDCVDANPNIYPGANEVCNAIDDNCDFQVDEGLPKVNVYKDVDGDGFGGINAQPKQSCLINGTDAPADYALTNDDCDDSKSTVFPNAPELCDGVLNNCAAAAAGMAADYSCPTVCAGSWPFALGGGAGTVSVAQLDDDSEYEVIASQGATTRVIGHNGVQQWAGSGTIYSYPSLADVNHDDTLDVLVPYGNTFRVLDGKTGTELFNVTSASSSGSYYGASAFDLDNDGWVDVVPTQNGGGPADLIQFNGTANPTVKKLTQLEAPFFLSNAALVDLDGNGKSEIALGSGNWSCKSNPTSCQGRFLVFDSSGVPVGTPAVDGSPFTNTGFPSSYSSEGQFPTFADFDHDGKAELAARFSDGVFVWDRAGAPHPLTKSAKVGSSVHFAPINADGSLNDGTLTVVGGPVVDIEGDGRYETIQQSGAGISLRTRGAEAPGYPIPIKGGSPIIADINRDGALDMLWVGDNNALNCYTLKPKTYVPTQVLTAGGYSTVGAPGIYPTFQHDPFEPNQPSGAVDPKTTTNPSADFRAFVPWGMREKFQSGAGNQHTVVAELGEQGDEDWYFITNSFSNITVTPHVPSKADVTLDVYQYAPGGGGWQYQCQASGKSLYFHPNNATGDCLAGITGTRGLLIRVRGVDAAKDWGPYPYTLNFIWR
jgi:hypothetical protein